MIMTNEMAFAIAEINEILNYLSIQQVNKIPLKLRNMFTLVSHANYIPHINPNKSILEQDISTKTKDILVLFYRNYWSDSDNKNEIDKILDENENRYQLELSQKYSTYNIFNSSNSAMTLPENDVQDNKLIVKKDNFITKIINKLKSWFSH